jgi:hypothetical protein
MSSKESQTDEICAVDSIYSEEEIQTREENGALGGQFDGYIDLPAGFTEGRLGEIFSTT